MAMIVIIITTIVVISQSRSNHHLSIKMWDDKKEEENIECVYFIPNYFFETPQNFTIELLYIKWSVPRYWKLDIKLYSSSLYIKASVKIKKIFSIKKGFSVNFIFHFSGIPPWIVFCCMCCLLIYVPIPALRPAIITWNL